MSGHATNRGPELTADDAAAFPTLHQLFQVTNLINAKSTSDENAVMLQKPHAIMLVVVRLLSRVTSVLAMGIHD